MISKKVLVISNPEDEHTKCVVGKIRQIGAEPVLFFTEYLGQESMLALNQSRNKQPLLTLTLSRAKEVNLDEVYSVWYRRPRPVLIDMEVVRSKASEFAQYEWEAALESIYALMANPVWVSHPDRLRESARKPLQLHIAHQLGMSTPRTLITNEPGKVREFFRACRGKVVVKATGRGWVYSDDGTDIEYVLTNRVSPSDLDADEEIRIAPITIQEEVEKDYEIRANIVGQEVLAIRIDSQQSEISELDWRRYDIENTPYLPESLPADIEMKCLKLAKRLGIEFGALDLIRKPNGDYVFLEINGNGQFLWAEELSGVKVSDALARLLAGIAPPLKSAEIE